MTTKFTGPALRPTAARLRRRVRQSALTVPILHILGGIVAALAMLAVDGAVAEEGVPSWLHIGESLAQASLIGLVTSFLFVVSVVFWVRIWAVQVSAQPVLNRVLSQFLTDRVQRHSMGFIIGAMAYTLTVMRALPQDGVGMDAVPHLAVSVAYVLAVAIAVIIVFAVDNAARRGQVGRLVRQIAERTAATVEANHPPLDGSDRDGVSVADLRPSDQRPATVVEAETKGWIGGTDDDALLDAVAPGATIELTVRVGSFVLPGTPLARVWTDRDDDVAVDRIRHAITLHAEPSLDDDIAYGLGELIDIASRAVATSNSDMTTAREAVLHLGVALRELLVRELPPVTREDDDRRRLLRGRDLRFADYLDLTFGRLRTVAAGSTTLTDASLTVIDMLHQQIEDLDRPHREELLEEQARLLLDEAHERTTLEKPRQWLTAAAEARELSTERTTTQQ